MTIGNGVLESSEYNHPWFPFVFHTWEPNPFGLPRKVACTSLRVVEEISATVADINRRIRDRKAELDAIAATDFKARLNLNVQAGAFTGSETKVIIDPGTADSNGMIVTVPGKVIAYNLGTAAAVGYERVEARKSNTAQDPMAGADSDTGAVALSVPEDIRRIVHSNDRGEPRVSPNVVTVLDSATSVRVLGPGTALHTNPAADSDGTESASPTASDAEVESRLSRRFLIIAVETGDGPEVAAMSALNPATDSDDGRAGPLIQKSRPRTRTRQIMVEDRDGLLHASVRKILDFLLVVSYCLFARGIVYPSFSGLLSQSGLGTVSDFRSIQKCQGLLRRTESIFCWSYALVFGLYQILDLFLPVPGDSTLIYTKFSQSLTLYLLSRNMQPVARTKKAPPRMNWQSDDVGPRGAGSSAASSAPGAEPRASRAAQVPSAPVMSEEQREVERAPKSRHR